MNTNKRQSLTLALILSVVTAKIDWNLESTFLQYLQQQANETDATVEEAFQAARIYPTWVSESTCSTTCVDLRGDEEFCVAASVCENATWRKAFDRHKSTTSDLSSFEPQMSLSSCEVWGDLNRCDGLLCEADKECQSTCCGAFVSFTHHRCLPLLGDYCPGRDSTRKHLSKNAENSLPFGQEEYIHALEEHQTQKEALSEQAKERLADVAPYGDISQIVEELVQLQSYMQTESNEIPVNGRRKREFEAACRESGSKDLCDDILCEYDGMCRSGCCSQVLTFGYQRCAAMLVGDYCPRVLDPIVVMIKKEKELKDAADAKRTLAEKEAQSAKEKEKEKEKAQKEPVKKADEPSVLPCNVFGTVDRCDGMACEHDGNCFSGCCSLFVSGEHKRCMPLVGNDLCPIAIDVVQYQNIESQEKQETLDQPFHSEDYYEEPLPVYVEQETKNEEIDDADHPIMMKEEHFDEYQDAEHIIPEKREHHDEYQDPEHIVPEKREHHSHDYLKDLEKEVPIIAKDEHTVPAAVPAPKWKPDFHGEHAATKPHFAKHHYGHADGIDENFLDEETGMLKPVEPKKDDPRLMIPQGKTAALHDHIIVPKEPIISEPIYGQAYEHDRKEALHGPVPSPGLAPKVPIKERKTLVPTVHPEPVSRKPCNTYGTENRCDGMSCSNDGDCASKCCGQTTHDGTSKCQSLIEDMFCPRALATKVDYTKYTSDDRRRNAMTPLNPRSNEMPTYRGADGCKVHGNDEQCDGQPCSEDHDCLSGCCGTFISFNLRRCLPLTSDFLCPRVLEPSFTSPVPARLPTIEQTIKNMYEIQNRVNHLEEVLKPGSLQVSNDALQCRSYGQEKLCDGFICSEGSSCQSGCCATFGTLKQDYCQPTIMEVCPVTGFTYGPKGDIRAVNTTSSKKDDIANPSQSQLDVTGSNPPTEQKKENAFWNGVIVGVVIWIGVLAAVLALYFCCKKKLPVSPASDISQYQDLPASSH